MIFQVNSEDEMDMANIKKNATELIGNTPLLELNQFSAKVGLETPILAKLEYLNPTGKA